MQRASKDHDFTAVLTQHFEIVSHSLRFVQLCIYELHISSEWKKTWGSCSRTQKEIPSVKPIQNFSTSSFCTYFNILEGYAVRHADKGRIRNFVVGIFINDDAVKDKVFKRWGS